MSRSQIILILSAIAITAALYFFGSTVPSEKKPEAEPENKNVVPKEFNFDKIISNAKSDFAESQSENMKKLEEELSHSADANTKSAILKKIAERWDNYQHAEISAHYLFLAAEAVPSEDNWTDAAQKFVFSADITKDTLLKDYCIEKAIVSYKKTLAINPGNNENKINLAVCYVYGNSPETMQGVTLLLDVVKQDSMNVRANFLLGKLAMKSGQFEKAIIRFEKVVSLDSGNAEAFLNLAEANQSLGNNNKAIEYFEKCKLLVSNPDFKREIDLYINKLKTN